MGGFARRGVGLAVAAAIALTAVGAPAAAAVPTGLPPVEDRAASGVTADALPTVQIDNGVVWDQAIVGTTVYAGGQFSQTRPAGAAAGRNLTPRLNLLAYDVTTGELTSFAPRINGVVRSVEASPDGRRIYVGGTFTQVDASPRHNIAAFDVATGALVEDFQARIGGSAVYALTVTDSAVYAGGLFSQANGTTRKNLAAFDTTGVLRGWAPTTDMQVESMVSLPDGRIVAAGRFGVVNGRRSPGTANLAADTGALLPWALNASASTGIVNGGSPTANSGTMGLSTDGRYVYGAAWQHGAEKVSNIEGLWAADAATGALVWMTAGKGDHYDVQAVGDLVYGVGHSHEASGFGAWADWGSPSGDYQNSIAVTTQAKGTNAKGSYWNNVGKPAPAMTHWYPKWITGSFTGMGQAGWTVEGNEDYVAIGGEFLGVNGTLQQGLVRFATQQHSTSRQGPRLSEKPNNPADTWERPTATTRRGGVRVTIRPNFDRDDRTLTYELLRSDTSEPVARTRYASDWWTRGSSVVTLTDFGTTPGAKYTYTVRAVDRDGNTATSASVSGTAGAGTTKPPSRYSSTVMADGPSLYWRLGGVPLNAGIDWAGSNDAAFGSGVVPASSSAVFADTGTGSRFDGTDRGRFGTSARVATPARFSTEVWFSTTTTRGGKLSGFGNSQLGASTANDRHVYMRNDGRLVFGVYTGQTRTIVTPEPYNDGAWHHVVATLDGGGMRLYVDGAEVVRNAGVTTSTDSYTGYWRLGGDTIGSAWAGVPSSRNFAGDLDEFAVYTVPLTDEQVLNHYVTATDPTQAPPVASFATTTDGMRVAVDGSASKAWGDKQIASMTWNFGDGTSATGPTAEHVYARAGTYAVTLVVTDTAGIVSTGEERVEVHSPYTSAVLADGASLYWSLGQDPQPARDLAGSNDGQVGSGIVGIAEDAAWGDVPGAMSFASPNGSIVSSQKVTAPKSSFSQEVWFRTTTTRGGLLLGYTGNRTGIAGSNDRDLFMNNAGQIAHSVYPGANRTLTSRLSYNDGQWHHAVVTVGPAGHVMYIDGARVVTNSATTSAEGIAGYWRVGYGPLWGSATASNSFAGDIDEVAVYGRVLTDAQVAAHHTIGRTEPTPAEPVDPPAPPQPGDAIASDDFERTGTTWGTSSGGHAWRSESGMTTADGRGVVELAPGLSRTAWLTDAQGRDVDLTMDFSLDAEANSSGTFVSAVVRRTEAGDYRLQTIVSGDRYVTVSLSKRVGTEETILATQVLAGYRYSVGSTLRMRVSAQTVDGVTQLRGSVWDPAGAEPETPTVVATDSEPALADAGTIGLVTYLSARSTVAQVIRVDDLRVVAP